MSAKEHQYQVIVEWTGNEGQGTAGYTAYSRAHTIKMEGKPELPGSSDPAFRGDPVRYNPEELFLSSLSTCHMLWYLHFCAVAGIIVTSYKDAAQGTMQLSEDGNGYFAEVVLHPVLEITDASKKEEAIRLHQKAHQYCFIANSVNFPVKHQPEILIKAM